MPTTIAALTREHVDASSSPSRKGHRPATVSQRFRSLQQFFKWLKDDGEVKQSPMANIRPPHVPRNRRRSSATTTSSVSWPRPAAMASTSDATLLIQDEAFPTARAAGFRQDHRQRHERGGCNGEDPSAPRPPESAGPAAQSWRCDGGTSRPITASLRRCGESDRGRGPAMWIVRFRRAQGVRRGNEGGGMSPDRCRSGAPVFGPTTYAEAHRYAAASLRALLRERRCGRPAHPWGSTG